MTQAEKQALLASLTPTASAAIAAKPMTLETLAAARTPSQDAFETAVANEVAKRLGVVRKPVIDNNTEALINKQPGLKALLLDMPITNTVTPINTLTPTGRKNTMTKKEQAAFNLAEIARYKAENAALLAQVSKTSSSAGPRKPSFKVGEKGGICIYGLGRFPIHLYLSQKEVLFSKETIADLDAFIAANIDKLAVKPTKYSS